MEKNKCFLMVYTKKVNMKKKEHNTHWARGSYV